MKNGLETLTILIVDDNDQVRTIVGTLLMGAGVHKVHYAKDAQQGISLVRAVPIDVAFVDQEMPGMSGVDFIAAVRRLETDKRYMPLIMMTAHSDMNRLTAARDAGVTEFLAKPITAEGVMQRMKAVIMQPRAFIKAPEYFGPDRRRRADPNYKGPLRRISDQPNVLAL